MLNAYTRLAQSRVLVQWSKYRCGGFTELMPTLYPIDNTLSARCYRMECGLVATLLQVWVRFTTHCPLCDTSLSVEAQVVSGR